ncbi:MULTISPECIES: alpha/beta hydrolase [Paraburkholderia]|uniref:alpha/beta hydrolase n=1 Tax=Paraburkholderia TaxID=1822464 RepID=UPI002258B1F4|nr:MULTISPECIES: alpha/beta fold hydrolase [Paraburkholderia]MCX4166251.1 alpha/beta fold hydrolase [Paraburkholderia megapolitana]MDN7161741.1 lysophospholipase [Paraburkholderia sp. CHISQ3]MDQ6498789.1 lysophospholipase [Paraburkholderia megapolitana]
MVTLAALAVAATIQSGAPALNTQAEIEAPGPMGPLRGTMLTPAPASTSHGVPVVLIVPGSGPTDRDGNSPLGIHASSYRLLAEGLAAHGIATVRIDKRGMFGSAAAIPDANAVTIDDYASDIRSWITTVRRQTDAPCVWVLGHSEGGLVALVAAQHTPHICGLILVATPGRRLGDVLREQLLAAPGIAPIANHAMSVLNTLESGQRVDAATVGPALMPLFAPQVQGFLMSELSLDPAALIANYHQPVLIVQGERDIQVSTTDARRLKHAAPDAQLALLANMNHALKTVSTDDRNENHATYANPDLPLANDVVDVIANFVKEPQKNR